MALTNYQELIYEQLHGQYKKGKKSHLSLLLVPTRDLLSGGKSVAYVQSYQMPKIIGTTL